MKRWLPIAFLVAVSFIWLGNALTSTVQPDVQSPVQLYATETLDDLQLVFKQAIDEAKTTITLIIYSLRDKKIIQALRDASDRGVLVKVVCDPHASSGVAKKLGSKVDTFYRKGKGLMHQKILNVDQSKVWVGSANMTSASLKMHGNLVIGIYQEELARTISKKAKMMSEQGMINAVPAESFKVDGQQLEMWFFPDSPDGPKKIKELIRTAKKSIRIAMFTWTRFDLADAIIAAHKRGVNVDVVLDRNSAQGVSEPIAKKLHQAGISVRLNRGQELLHHKFLLIDDLVLVNGSANWTLAAFTQNDDCFMLLYPLTNKQQDHLKRLWNEIKADSQPMNAP